MSSREEILANIKKNQTEFSVLNDFNWPEGNGVAVFENFVTVLESIGGEVTTVRNLEEIKIQIKNKYTNAQRIISSENKFEDFAEVNWMDKDAHSLENVDLCILHGHFGVAENGAIWLTENLLFQRAAPFITQYLAVIIDKSQLVQTMHQAYDKIAVSDYGFGVFIAGPSKTADIEQSLVLGAHGARRLSVFVLEN